jgi:hypothetical protein
VVVHLPEELFPEGARAGWWAKPSSLIWVWPKNMYGKGASSNGMADIRRRLSPAPSISERFDTN